MRTTLPPRRRRQQPPDAAPDRGREVTQVYPQQPQQRIDGERIAASDAKDHAKARSVAGPPRKRRKSFVL